MNKSTDCKFKKILMVSFVLVLTIILAILLVITTDSKKIKNIKKFTSNDTKVLYITNKNKYLKYVVDMLDKYDAEYMHIDSSIISNIEKKKIQTIIDNNNITNIIVIFQDGKIKDTLLNCENENEINKFLQFNNIVPEVIGDNKNIISLVEKLLDTDLSLIYIPYEYVNGISEQDEMLKNISNNYNINYKMINAYLLSDVQKQKLNSILKVSPVDEQIVILVKDKKIVGNIRDRHTSVEYIEKLNELKFVQNKENYIKEINYDEFNNIIELNEKSVILIIKDDCKYCDELNKTLNSIIMEYGIKINYINVGDIDSELSKNVSNKLNSLGYNDGFTSPMTIMFESNKIINYVIGPSTEEYFVDIFTENGIIK